jgi:hypothetical protein
MTDPLKEQPLHTRNAQPLSYPDLVRYFLLLGYRIASFHDFSPVRADIILRHDVDISLECAVRLAEVEESFAWKSTYFVLITSEFYNVFSRGTADLIKSIARKGHEIGLHFDPSVYQPECDLESVARRECDVLEQLLGKPVIITAAHRPSSTASSFLRLEGNFADRVHAYQPRFFTEAAYLSDSSGYWAFGHPHDHPALKHRLGVQLLTHPYLWCDSRHLTRDEKIEELLRDRMIALRQEARRNFRNFDP